MPKILVVDDENDYHKLLKIILKPEGYSVISAYDGQEGIEKIYKEKPDLVILDINMPKMSGWEVCNEIRKDQKLAYIPILMLTVRSKQEEQIRGLQIGSDDYMTKPFNPDRLVTRVNAIIRRVKAMKK
ncbi:MAG: response regulator [Elusimicrobiota bacterium]